MVLVRERRRKLFPREMRHRHRLVCWPTQGAGVLLSCFRDDAGCYSQSASFSVTLEQAAPEITFDVE